MAYQQQWHLNLVSFKTFTLIKRAIQFTIGSPFFIVQKTIVREQLLLKLLIDYLRLIQINKRI